jgi:hypothetical protein
MFIVANQSSIGQKTPLGLSPLCSSITKFLHFVLVLTNKFVELARTKNHLNWLLRPQILHKSLALKNLLIEMELLQQEWHRFATIS